jgi:glycolate oxidase FAD binding subunit
VAPITPSTPEELAAALGEANREGRCPHFSLERMNRVLKYTPDDLTISVEAGITLGEINRLLAEHKQWLPIGAPRPDRMTAGQALAANPSGPFRLFYGTLRDMVVGVRFATTDGTVVKSGGEVVKNVAGYDLAKLLIGSRDTLTVPVQINFRVHSRPAFTETSVLVFPTATVALEARTKIQQSPLTPLAMDLVSAGVADFTKWTLLVAYGGVERVIERYRREIGGTILTGADEQRLWDTVCDLPAVMEDRGATRVRAASTIMSIGAGIDALPADAVVSRAGTGVTYFYGTSLDQAKRALAGVAESVTQEFPAAPEPPAHYGALSARLKQAFDPNGILAGGL